MFKKEMLIWFCRLQNNVKYKIKLQNITNLNLHYDKVYCYIALPAVSTDLCVVKMLIKFAFTHNLGQQRITDLLWHRER